MTEAERHRSLNWFFAARSLSSERFRFMSLSPEEARALLSQQRPDFLDQLDSRPKWALDRFMEAAWIYLRSVRVRFRPWRLGGPPADDIIHGALVRLVDDDFKRLRTYTPQDGHQFIHWLNRAVRNYHSNENQRHVAESDKRVDEQETSTLENQGDPTDLRAHLRLSADRVINEFRKLSDHCQELLTLRLIRDLSNQEIAVLLRRPGRHQRIGAEFFQCRKKLIELLSTQGPGPSELLP